MLSLIRNVSLLVLVIATAALVATALPTLWGGHLGGATLRFHMMASGAVVVLLPVYAITRLWMRRQPASESAFEMGAFRTLLIFGVATIATMFVCMLPIASTDVMHDLVELHGWAGFAMAAAIALVVYATFWRENTAS
ncbi:putative transmembrane region and signal peptide protein [Rhodopirellula islandica]|uniref:Transmembrane region and signal peptide protein n=1 Tax=Rhodopirellula islandica TaxID=595434 RepID=A0A0J1B4Y3_RHOIS|nr:hypothetical protein [Rhodopirellula islandica]KLU01792.1 putative transmembrane region and signal peptide protein [Rhodopirellula islandica]